MTQHTAIRLFEEKRVRTVWDDKQEKWFFSVVNVVAVLTDSANPTDYLKKMRKRDLELGSFVRVTQKYNGSPSIYFYWTPIE